MSTWTKEKSEKIYGFQRWGDGYFSIDDQGQVCVRPRKSGAAIPIPAALREALAEGLKPPLLLRFQDILRDRVEGLHQAFAQAIQQENYQGRYQGVFPVKVNQLREVIEEILEAGKPLDFGLEAGSKPELLLALAHVDDPARLIICNGYKDETFMRLAFLGKKLGKSVIIVIEQLEEVDLIIRLARELSVDPMIGIRVKLQAQGEGKWAASTGETAKFGLTATEVIAAAEKLDKAGLRHTLKLIHFHVGSQVPNILILKNAVIEAARYYCDLQKRGFPLEYLDVGGGLGIDYDGSRTNFDSSMNYSLPVYARDVVYNIQTVCQHADVPVPHIISESGRAIVAPHSVLILEVVSRISYLEHPAPKNGDGVEAHPIIEDLRHNLTHASRYTSLERYHDAVQKREEAYSLFNLGYLDLESRAIVESLYWKICQELLSELPATGYQHEELLKLRSTLVDQYVCNFSVFQSLLDHWALDQLFPVAPIHRHLEKPAVNAVLADITCDSDGKICKFIDLEEELSEYLPVHPLKDEPYYLGIFLTGAYQDIMGDMHNLFGKVPEAHVFLEEDEEDGFYIEELIHGNPNKEVLEHTQYPAHHLTRMMKQQVDSATKADRLKPREGIQLLNFYQKTLENSMYLELD